MSNGHAWFLGVVSCKQNPPPPHLKNPAYAPAGALTGFTNLGETNQHLLKFQQQVEESDTIDKQPLANSMFVIMVRGLLSPLQFPYAQFPCVKITGDLLVDPFWEAVNRLEGLGLRVLAATADGASTNRRFMKLHRY